MKNIPLKLILIIILSSPLTLSAQSNLERKIEDVLTKYADTKSPGVNIVITKKDKIIITSQLGLANLEYKQLLSPRTRFQAGFLSQQFTAYAILLLAQEEKISLEDDIRTYLPELNKFEDNITIQNLLSHSSGMYDYWSLKAIAGWRNDDYFNKQIALNYLINQTSLNYSPGSNAYKSNSNYLLLAEIISSVTKIPFEDYVLENIIKPIGMEYTFFNSHFNKVYSDKASYYYDWGQGWEYENMIYYNPGPVGLISTSEDFGKWLIHINKLHMDNDEIWKNLSTRKSLANDKQTNFTCGFQVRDDLKFKILFQNGFYNGYRSYMAYSVREEIGILVWSNYMSLNARKVAEEILNQIITLPTLKKNKQAASKNMELNVTEMKKYVGYYFDDKEYHTKRIYLKNDTLRLHDMDYDDYYKIIAIGKDRFKTQNTMSSTFFEFSSSNENKYFKIYRNNKVPELYKEFVPKTYTTSELAKFEGYYYAPLLGVGYDIKLEIGKLTANHHRAGNIKLRPKNKNTFVSGEWFFSSIDFKIEKGKILGFFVNTPEIKSLYFEKLTRY